MAEAIVNLVLNRLAEAAVKEILSFYGAEGKLDSLQHELHWIRAFLKDAEMKQNLDEKVKTWVNEVRDVAFRIEDVIDTFIVVADDRNHLRNVNAIKRVLKYPKKLLNVHKFIGEIDAIETRLIEIKEWGERYGINKELGDNSKAVPTRRTIREVVLPDVDDPDVIGLEKDKEEIVKLLLDPTTTRRCVLSIIGQGGLGKTTLAKKAYNSDEVKRTFKFRFWLSISQQFILVDLLKTMLESIRSLNGHEKDLLERKDPASEQRAEEHFIRELCILLKEKRYLVIMDDVWTENLWIQIEKALPNVENGSRVLVTTRFSEIAKRADPTCNAYDLRYLCDEESQQLLLRKAFPYQDPKVYLHDLCNLPKRFSIKCGGLPLALIVVGGLLSRQHPTFNSWHKIFKKFSWQTDDGSKCTEILVTSYEDLPIVLKPCFMYFASFPEDHQIKVKSLIRMWVSEGFIPELNNRTMEETAEDYMEDLVQRCMIQVSRRSWNGSIKYCRIHDLLRELAIEKAKENNFVQLISTKRDQSCSYTIRRVTLHCDCEDIMKYTGPNLRSLLYFNGNMPNVARFRYLKVLYHVAWKSGRNKWHVSKEMTQLRYLMNSSLRGSLYHEHEIEIWKSIGCMRNLQTLDLKNYSGFARPDCIWNIETLRHVILPKLNFEGPPSTADLPNLQTLKTVRVREEWLVNGWPKMPSIRVLKLWDFPPKYDESFCIFLNGLHHLTSLHISVHRIGRASSYVVLDMSTFPSYSYMQSLLVAGEWDWNQNQLMSCNSLDIRLFPIHLIKLTLWNSRIKEDPMPVLEKLKCLRKLTLYESYDGKQLSCSAGGFPQLEYLKLKWLEYLEDWKVEKGAMPLLKEIFIASCSKLVTIPELQHITSLNHLTLQNVHPDFLLKLEGEELYKTQHIPLIHID
ncbi:hypothetical protein LUZ61_004906 [Rhynchospora tenuis]|uniref:Uncharacterized protein n=1 Tax=Rhynchospora tenuis TaxID=198213 RepID=A0AAD6EU45_9POAL|nr:hypothetical protein LUZ61_004906 [Rhynchospora tenuis]